MTSAPRCVTLLLMGRHQAAATLLLLVAVATAVPASAADRDGRQVRRGQRVTEHVQIVNWAFRPRRLEVERGTRVRWTNDALAAHTTTSLSDLWDSGPLTRGQSFSRIFRREGTFRYGCTVHPDMTGRIVVT